MDNRKELLSKFINIALVNLSMEELYQLAGEQMETYYNSFSDTELLEEINYYYPEILSDNA